MMFLVRFLLFFVASTICRNFLPRKRTRNITWYNPSFASNVKTNLGRKFLQIVDKCFPKNHPLHKISNRHTLKLSYSCMPNMKSIISSHNKHILSKTNTPTQQPDTCNCRKKPECSLEGNCLQTNVIYQATDLRQTLRNVTEIIRLPFDTRREEMKQNCPNMFGICKTPRNRLE